YFIVRLSFLAHCRSLLLIFHKMVHRRIQNFAMPPTPWVPPQPKTRTWRLKNGVRLTSCIGEEIHYPGDMMTETGKVSWHIIDCAGDDVYYMDSQDRNNTSTTFSGHAINKASFTQDSFSVEFFKKTTFAVNRHSFFNFPYYICENNRERTFEIASLFTDQVITLSKALCGLSSTFEHPMFVYKDQLVVAGTKTTVQKDRGHRSYEDWNFCGSYQDKEGFTSIRLLADGDRRIPASITLPV
ncbi:hypothetical protein PFISCL1PPCAC_11632, partial [Pristionchus fissidentatus]